MQFKIVVTERAGMGISWDEEMPPMYEDVPVSPPGYGNVKVEEVEEFEGWELDAEVDGEAEGEGQRERRSGSGSRERT